MRLRVIQNGSSQQMQLFDSEYKVKSVRPATPQEAWMFGELESLNTENGQLEHRLEVAAEAAATYSRELEILQGTYDQLVRERDELAAYNATLRRTIEIKEHGHEPF